STRLVFFLMRQYTTDSIQRRVTKWLGARNAWIFVSRIPLLKGWMRPTTSGLLSSPFGRTRLLKMSLSMLLQQHQVNVHCMLSPYVFARSITAALISSFPTAAECTLQKFARLFVFSTPTSTRQRLRKPSNCSRGDVCRPMAVNGKNSWKQFPRHAEKRFLNR